MRVLGIETSCDETAAAVVELAGPVDCGTSSGGRILSNRVLSQIEEHAPFGGVVPEVAARAHLSHLDGLIAGALADADVGLADLDGIAATGGPGLIGGVMVGVTEAKALALVANRPFIAVNHLEAHALTARLTAAETGAAPFPYLMLLVSGGHAQLLAVRGVGDYVRLGTTIDDAVGEAFDKTAKILGLGYPGGPALEEIARGGDAKAHAFPRPLRGKPGCDFSFSGLKAAVARLAAREQEGRLATFTPQAKADIAASFQAAVADVLAERTRNAIDVFLKDHSAGGEGHTIVLAGGVAANQTIRTRLESVAAENGMTLAAPPIALCTDNAAMVAWAGIERLALGLTDTLDFQPRPRWPLDATAPKKPFAGAKA